MSRVRKPSELHPRIAARELGLHVEGQPSWPALLDAAFAAYWERRPEQNPRTLAEYRRRQGRKRTSPEVWVRRAGAA